MIFITSCAHNTHSSVVSPECSLRQQQLSFPDNGQSCWELCSGPRGLCLSTGQTPWPALKTCALGTSDGPGTRSCLGSSLEAPTKPRQHQEQTLCRKPAGRKSTQGALFMEVNTEFSCLWVPAVTELLFSAEIEPFISKTSRRCTYFGEWVFVKPSDEFSELCTREFVQQGHQGLGCVGAIISLVWDLKDKGKGTLWDFTALLWMPERHFRP